MYFNENSRPTVIPQAGITKPAKWPASQAPRYNKPLGPGDGVMDDRLAMTLSLSCS